jgi:23S rRNA pseudouridine1911/1915/1917 synthase
MQVQSVGEWLVAKLDGSWAGKTVDECLTDALHMSPKQINHLLNLKAICLDSQVLRLQDRNKQLQPGMNLRLHILQPEEYGVEPEFLPQVDIVWEDDHCLVANKPADMLVHPDTPERKGTLDAAVAFHLLSQGLEAKVRHVHRLDRDTSGLVLFAKHAEAHRILDQQLAEKRVSRRYYALVQGQVEKKKGCIREPIGRDRHNRKKRMVVKTGAHAVTHFERKAVWRDLRLGMVSLLELQLETGRTHQIRVHVSHMGHPIIGDTLYDGPTHPEIRPGRHALHAYRLAFTHPYSTETIENQIGWPLDLQPLLQDWDGTLG